MTSKELLEHIKNAPSFKGGDTRYTMVSNSATQYDADIKQIERDLEVLDILKKYVLTADLLDNDTKVFQINALFMWDDVGYKEIKRWMEENE